jgi:uncharacterized protein (TIGR03435 family)
MVEATARKLSFSKMLFLIATAWMVLGSPVALGQAVAPQPAAAAAQTAAAGAASNLTFDVASVRPSALDMTAIIADTRAGKMPRVGARVDASRAEYSWMPLKSLIAAAYDVKEYQISGPDWLSIPSAQRFDIVAKMPEGASKDDAPKMLQALLAERFHLKLHIEMQEHPVLALVIGKGGPKLKESPASAPIDPDAPLKPGERQINGPNGPVRMTTNPDGSITRNMGAKGTYTMRSDGQTIHMEADTMTMAGFADMLTGLMQMGGTGGAKPVVDMTGLKGNFQVAVDFSMADLIAAAQAQGVGMPGGGGATGGAATVEASDPGGATAYASVEKLGLKLESRKAPVKQVVVDSSEKMPTEN